MDARFTCSAPSLAALPPPELPEVAIGGRSNCGKSSLINALVGQTRLARTSSTPGRTRHLVFFRVVFPELKPHPCHLVDLPGYGYARVSKAEQEAWGRLVPGYLSTRPGLQALVLLADARRTPGPEEQDLLAWVGERGLRALVVLTKIDKLNKSQRLRVLAQAQRLLALPRPPLGCSVREPESVAAVREAIVAVLGRSDTRDDPGGP